MKTLQMVLVAMLVVAFGGCADSSGTSGPDKVQAPAPEKSGADVLVPDQVVKAIPNFDSSKAVYAACDENGWFSSGGQVSESKKAATQMTKEGDFWRAKNLAGKRFHPVQLDGSGNPQWAQLEKVYDVNNDTWIDHSGGSPAILVK